jgi:hypothetical protein
VRQALGRSQGLLHLCPIARPDEKIVPNASKDFEEFEGWARRDSNPLPPVSEAATNSKQRIADVSKVRKYCTYLVRQSLTSCSKKAPVSTNEFTS